MGFRRLTFELRCSIRNIQRHKGTQKTCGEATRCHHYSER